MNRHQETTSIVHSSRRSVRLRLLFVALLIGASFSSAKVFADGGALFQNECVHCHAKVANGSAQVGPALVDIIGKPAAVQADYAYSDALQMQAASGLVWDAATLDRFIESPGEVIPGTKMSYKGLADEQKRKALILWLADPDAALQPTNDADTSAMSPEVEQILSLDADPDYGEYLAAECATCHSGSSASGGVPPIKGLPRPYFIQALLEYKNGVRDNSVMKLMAGNLGDDELAALAAYFSGGQ
ncbi:MAG: c-type cytochrome [Granulosicoccus sp.]|nr:c-type cytochrome [Granulosicoccus sp.]